MKCQILVMGRLKDRYLEEGITTYLTRFRSFLPTEVIRLKEEEKSSRDAEASAIATEAASILGKIESHDILIALSEEGRRLDSRGFAAELQTFLSESRGKIVFCIGSGPGLHTSVKERADLLLSLSPLTFPHQLALLLLAEQLYRASTILRGEPYHR